MPSDNISVYGITQKAGLDINKETTELLRESLKDIAPESIKFIKSQGSYNSKGKGKRYRSSFKFNFSKDDSEYIGVLHNQKYRLTHLLEKGHKTRNGGNTKAFPHWKPTEKYVEEQLINKLSANMDDKFMDDIADSIMNNLGG
jgi:hypothetical protein